MKTKEITVQYGRTVNLGNYETLRVDFSETVALDAKENATSVRAALFNQIKSEISEIVKATKDKVRK
jgi:hypothetical protein